MPQEEFIFRALRQQMLWPSLHAAIDVYFRRRASNADHYELIWRLIHICECTAMILAGTAITRIRELGKAPETYLKLREACYGVMWNSTESTLEKSSQGALDGSVDKWIEILQHVAGVAIDGSKFLASLKTFLVGPPENSAETHHIDLAPFVRAWGDACDVPPNVLPASVNIKEVIKAINSFRNRFAHVPFPYDQLKNIYGELELCVFKLFEIPPTAANDESPLSGIFGIKESVLRGSGYCKTPDKWPHPACETFAWGKPADLETWDARPFVLLDKMMRPYVLSRLKNEEAGAWEYSRFLAEKNAVHSLPDVELLKLLPRPNDHDYPELKEEVEKSPETGNEATYHEVVTSPGSTQIATRGDALVALKERNFEGAIEFFKAETDQRPSCHSDWQRLGFAQREYGVYLTDTDPEKAKELFRQSISSLTWATGNTNERHTAEAYYHRSKSHWRLGMLTQDEQQMKDAVKDADAAARHFYDQRFLSWLEFLKENLPSNEPATSSFSSRLSQNSRL